MKRSLLRLLCAALGLAAIFSLTGCLSDDDGPHDYVTTVARFVMESNDSSAFATVTLPISGTKIAVNPQPIFTEYDITHVDVGNSDMGKFLAFQLTQDATRALYRQTGENQGKRLVLIINGNPVGARLIEAPFSSGVIAVFAEVPDASLPDLVKNINATSKDIQKKLAKQRGY